ncbi:hypothetical protein J6590_102037, partial [Homalodisca vitripennis]
CASVVGGSKLDTTNTMDVVAMYDYYFFENPFRKFDDRCEYGICEKNIVYRRVRAAVEEWRESSHARVEGRRVLDDVLEYMLYNVAGDTGLPAHYSCCMYVYRTAGHGEGGAAECVHVCNAIPIMIGSRLEQKIVTRLAEMFDVPVAEVCDSEYLHNIYSGSFLVNGTFYYTVFRESNNNKICHNTTSKYRQGETVAYFYDDACNRGVKLFTNSSGELRMNDRDGNEVTVVTPAVMLQLYKECTPNWRQYTLDMALITGFFESVKERGSTGIDDLKNKIYTNYSIGLNRFLDKMPSTAMHDPMWNASLMVGKVNFGISQRLSYSTTKSETKKHNEQKLKMCTGGMSTGYLVETQRRRNTKNLNARRPGRRSSEVREPVPRRAVIGTRRSSAGNRGSSVDGALYSESANTILGSKDVKTVGFMEKMEQGERNGPSTFNQVSVSYLPLIRVLSHTVQKLQVEHVHAESSKTVPRDAYGFICMKYMGNISTAGKNMLFTERVQVSYGHVHLIVDAIEKGIENAVKQSNRDVAALAGLIRVHQTNEGGDRVHVVINNAVTKWSVASERLMEFVVFLKTRCHQYVWTKLFRGYLCVYYYEGVPLLRYNRGEMMFKELRERLGTAAAATLDCVDYLYFSRDELEWLASGYGPCGHGGDLINKTNALIDKWFVLARDDGGYDSVEHPSLLAKHVDQYTDYTAPAKRSVSVNARKSACINVYYQKAADLIRGFSIFTDPDGYERATAERVAADNGPPEWVTLRDFTRVRAEVDNCPQPQDGADPSFNNFYLFRTIFADVDGLNVEDANVLDESLDLCLSYSYSYSLTFVERTRSGLDIIVPPPRNAAAVCCWDVDGNPTTVIFMVCTIRKKDGDEEYDVGEVLGRSLDARMVRRDPTDGGAISFPPFRKLSVIQSDDGNYHVYFMRNDAVLLRSLRRLRERSGLARHRRPNMSNAVRLTDGGYAFVCEPEVKPYDALTYFQTKVTTFEANEGERVITLDVRVHGKSKKFDGVKVVNSFGQKGLALIRDLRQFIKHGSNNVPVQLVMNNCSFVSRQPVGQFLQMKKNMHEVAYSAAGEATSVGYSAVFLTETEPVTKSCQVRFDEMMRSVIITLGLTLFQNLKNSLDNVYNPLGLLYPPQTRQILSLYRCFGVSYTFAGDDWRPFASRNEIQTLNGIYDVYSKTKKPTKVTSLKALLDLPDALKVVKQHRRLVEAGVLTEIDRANGNGDDRVYVLRLQGQRKSDRATASEQPHYELRSYCSREKAYTELYVFGEPCFVTDILEDGWPTRKTT